jgi:predicted secreted protein
MATHGLNTDIWLGAYDVGTYFNNVNVPAEKDEVDVTGFGASGKSFVTGYKSGSIDLEGFFYGGDNEIDEQLESYFSADNAVVCTVMVTGDALGNPARIASIKQRTYNAGANVNDAAKISASLRANNGPNRGLVLHAKEAETATGNETGVDWGATSTTSDGFAAALHVFAISGGITFTPKLRDSADNSTYADVTGGGFTAVTAVGAQYLEGTASVRRYTRLDWTISGTGSVTFGVVLAKKF